ncbi:MAG: hypothetical protein P8Y14_07970 [Anaerolineales bacterium]|jgi:hypothetical protein
MQDSTALPDLRVLPVEQIIPHEEVDPRRADRLAQRIQIDGRLKNPPIVAAVPDSDLYVVLDGANRTMALKQLGASHIIAQVVHYGQPGLVLDTWYHVVSGMKLGDFEAALEQIDGLRLLSVTLDQAREALATNKAAAYIVSADQVWIISPRAESERDLPLLKEIVNTYRGKADIHRASNDDWSLQAPYYPYITALVIFPQLRPVDILTAARNGERVPSGITRHIIPNRALNTYFDMQVMLADWSLESKQQWLKEWLMERMASNAIRFYAESTFSFDE